MVRCDTALDGTAGHRAWPQLSVIFAVRGPTEQARLMAMTGWRQRFEEWYTRGGFPALKRPLRVALGPLAGRTEQGRANLRNEAEGR